MPPPKKNSEEAKKVMERVRNARQMIKQIPILNPKPGVEDTPLPVDVGNKEDEIELPKDKFMLLLNIIMELQRDIDFLIEAYRKIHD